MAAQLLQPLGRCCHAGTSHRRLGRLVRTAAMLCMEGPHTASVPVPLCKRAPSFQDSVGNVLAWQQAVEGRMDQIGDGFVRLDEGPSADELKREVGWVLEDVIAEVQYSAQGPWEPCDWRQLQPEIRVARLRQQDPTAWQLRLRAPVKQLHEWWTQRLEERVPFQYLIATAHWSTYILSVSPGILIPRPETEIFPDLALQAVDRHPHLAALPWVDLGTGSGAIAIGTADKLRRRNKAACLLAVDINPIAVAHARANAAAAGLDQHVTVLQGSWLQPVLEHLAGGQTTQPTQPTQPAQPTQPTLPPLPTQPILLTAGQPTQQPTQPEQGSIQAEEGPALQGSSQAEGGLPLQDSSHSSWQGPPLLGGILSNPPYIPRSVMEAGLQAEVGRHEPWTALDGGPGDGLDSLQVICNGAAAALLPGGFLALETAGADQAALVAALLARQGAFAHITVVEDCYGVQRFVTAHRQQAGAACT